jgi:hypothetical protein
MYGRACRWRCASPDYEERGRGRTHTRSTDVLVVRRYVLASAKRGERLSGGILFRGFNLFFFTPGNAHNYCVNDSLHRPNHRGSFDLHTSFDGYFGISQTREN